MRNAKFFRYLAYSLEILVFFVLSCTPKFLPDIFGAKPSVLLAVGLTIAVNESEIPAMVFGLLCGLLTDLGFSTAVGTFAIGMTIVCFVIGYCANNLIGANFLNVMITCFVCVAAMMSIHFAFVMSGYDGAGTYYLNHYVSRIIQTVVACAILYFVNKFVYLTLYEDK